MIWLIAGHITYIVEMYRPKTENEKTFTYKQCIVFGIVGLVAILVTLLATDANEYEDDLY